MITLKQTLSDIISDLPHKSIKGFFRNYFYNPGFRILLNHRIGKYFYTSRFLPLRQIGNYYKVRLIVKRSCDISYNATIGKNVRFPHPLGIVIGDHVVIHDNVKIWQQVTFGSHGKKERELEYPVIESNVKIFAGAKIIGGITIGENSIVGANSVVNKDVPRNSVAYGIPCKIK